MDEKVESAMQARWASKYLDDSYEQRRGRAAGLDFAAAEEHYDQLVHCRFCDKPFNGLSGLRRMKPGLGYHGGNLAMCHECLTSTLAELVP